MDCWICGNPAETGEHKIKKSLLVSVWGKGPYKGDAAMSHVKNKRVHDIQGPDSQRIKYVATLCRDCNNRRTQPFDFAYDQFCRFVIRNEPDVLKHRVIDFDDVYGPGFEIEQLNLFKYFVKLLGCHLAYGGWPIPNDLRLLLDQQRFLTRLRITFAVNEDKLLLPGADGRPIGIGDLKTSERNLSHKDDPKYRWHTYFSFLHIFYWYSTDSDGPYGATWIADSRYLYLGSYYALTPEQRADVKARVEHQD
jgi:hypothetical protein